MRIDRSHRGWLIFSLAFLAVAAGGYWLYLRNGSARLNGPSGASWEGLVFGSVGSAFMLFAALLGVRKRLRTLRIGRAEHWMRGHLWLGLLALPMLWFHGGFKHGGALTTILMFILYAIIITGLIGAFFQHFLPSAMTRIVRNETIYEQIDQVVMHMAVEAEELAAVCGPLHGEQIEVWRKKRLAAISARQKRSLMTDERRAQLEQLVHSAPAPSTEPLKDLYVNHIAPYIRSGGRKVPTLIDPIRAESIFTQRRLTTLPALHPVLADLERLCVEVRQLRLQTRLHRWLHSWLLIHAPLTAALIILGIVHAFVALRWK